MQQTERPRPVRRGSVTVALILIVVGFLWLLNNLGYLPPHIWLNLWRFWPAILILLGADIALRGFPAWFSLPILILVVVLVLGAVVFLAPTLPPEEVVTESFSQELGDLSQATIELEMDGASLHAQPSEEQREFLITGEFSHSNSVFIQREFTDSSGKGFLRFADRYEAMFPFFFFPEGRENEWRLELTPEVPLAIQLDAEDCQLEVNLNNLMVETLSAEIQGCSGELTLPSADGLHASMQVNDSSLVVITPTEAGARVDLILDDSGLTIDSARFTKISEGEYLSPAYHEAEKKIDLVLRATDSSVSIE